MPYIMKDHFSLEVKNIPAESEPNICPGAKNGRDAGGREGGSGISSVGSDNCVGRRQSMLSNFTQAWIRKWFLMKKKQQIVEGS